MKPCCEIAAQFQRVCLDCNKPQRAPRAKKPARGAFGPIYKGFIARLKDLGCVLCPACHAYLAATHVHPIPVPTRLRLKARGN